MHESNPATGRADPLEFLNLRLNFERTISMPYRGKGLKLQRMRELLEKLNHPERGLPVIHIAGTKGKGSTAAICSALLVRAGYRVGRYTSPHLEFVEERIAINGQTCSTAEMRRLIEAIRPAVEEMDSQAMLSGGKTIGPTYFEMATAAALLHFARQKVDLAVIEVGMGGRLDSTNVCQPIVSVITSISFDHMRQLGNTLAAIAGEKAGIIKPAIPVVSGVASGEAQQVIERVCREKGSALRQIGRDFFARDYRIHRGTLQGGAVAEFDYEYMGNGEPGRLEKLPLTLLGRHQAHNAAVSLAAIQLVDGLGFPVSEEAIRAGLAEVNWPARQEVVQASPLVLLDGAHNVASVEALVDTIKARFPVEERVLVFGTTLDKQIEGMLALLAKEFRVVICTSYVDNPRGVPVDQVATVARAAGFMDVRVERDPPSAWKLAKGMVGQTGLICVTGSLLLAGEMRRVLRQDQGSQS